MTDRDIIQQITQEIDVPFPQLTLDELVKEPHEQGKRGYTLDNDNNVIALRLCNTVFENSYLLTKLPHLHTLFLKNNAIEDFSFVEKLDNVQAFYITARFLDDFSFITRLQNLTTLDISDNQMGDVSFLKELKSLTNLNLGSNIIKDVSFLKELKSLTYLDLSSNIIKDVSFLKELKSLTYLDLSSNIIKDVSFLKELKSLTNLDFSYNQISDVSFLKELKSLTNLDLRSDHIRDFSFLKELKSLTYLGLRSDHVIDFSFLKELKSLTNLDLSDNRIRDFSFLKELKSLTNLNLRFNQISNFSFFKELKELKNLCLSYNQISDVSFLKELKSLTYLDLSSNQISEFSFLKELKSLTYIDLSSNQISEFSFLKELKSLTYIDLSSNQISEFSFLKELKSLTHLDLSSNQISDLSFLKELKSLTYLGLSSNQISDVSFLKELESLTHLGLSSNQISDVSFLKELKSLTHLDLSSNIIKDVSFLKELKSLTYLYLSSNQISDFSFLMELKGLTKLDISCSQINNFSFLIKLEPLTSLELRDVKIKDFSFLLNTNNLIFLDTRGIQQKIIPETVWEKGPQAIRRYLIQKRDDVKKLYEAKVLFVGQPEAGKTTLMEKILDPNFEVPQPKQESTLGVDIKPNWTFNTVEKKKFKAHLWDFGGQTIQYYIHQFFLSKRSLYVLVIDDRQDGHHIDYWFNIIRVLGGPQTPVIVVRNEINIKNPLGFDETQYRKTHGDYLDLSFFSVDLSDISDGRLDVIIKYIQKKLSHLEHIGEELPAGWIDVRKQIEKIKKENIIHWKTFSDICTKFEIKTVQDQHMLSTYLHDLGIIQHFQNETALFDCVFVNPDWLTKAVYKILSKKDLEKKNGCFSKTWLFNAWGKTYKPEEKHKILQLMQKKEFDLIYPFENNGEERFIVPRLLSKDAPKEANTFPSDGLAFRFKYPFMPEGLISRFIVRLFESIKRQDGKDMAWVNGVILADSGVEVLVKKGKNDELVPVIDILISDNGSSAKRFLAEIRQTLDDIHFSHFKNAKREIQFPCCCPLCNSNEKKTWFDFTSILNYLKSEEFDMKCEKGEKISSVKISDILFQVINSSEISFFDEKPIKNGFDVKFQFKTTSISDKLLDLPLYILQKLTFERKEKMNPKKSIFVSYSHKDQAWLDKVLPYLRALENIGYKIETWVDDKIKAGTNWKTEIDTALSNAKIGLCLVSMQFMDSPFITQVELKKLLTNANKKGTTILVLNVEDSIIHLHEDLIALQHINQPDQPLEDLEDREQRRVLKQMAERIAELAKEP